MLTVEEKSELMDTASEPGFTLNGRPAMLLGRLERFATVWAHSDKKGDTIQAEYAWEAVQQIINNGSREFFTN